MDSPLLLTCNLEQVKLKRYIIDKRGKITVSKCIFRERLSFKIPGRMRNFHFSVKLSSKVILVHGYICMNTAAYDEHHSIYRNVLNELSDVVCFVDKFSERQ